MTETESTKQYENTGASNRYVLLVGLVMLIGVLSLAWLGQPPRPKIIGERLPRIDLQPLLYATQVSNESLAGKVTLLHFWGTWCPPCIKEFPEFAELYEKYANNPEVTIISVSCSAGPEYEFDKLQAETSQFLSKFPGEIPTYADSAAMTRQQLTLVMGGSFGVPTTILVDRDGTIAEALIGSLPGDMQKLDKKIASLL
ncbi:MAG: TlpA family protein disulfide reductase [Planctomycetales bacterium]|nr:TlpA family protein disulfide reductase [Planctomycetales bacterium]